MAQNDINSYYESSTQKSRREKIVDSIIGIQNWRIFKFLGRKVLLRKTIFAGTLFFTCILLVLGGLMSPKRRTFSEDQLATSVTFGNNSGRLDLVSQTYSQSTGMAVLEFETFDTTGSVDTGIGSDNLDWELFFQSNIDSSETELQVISLTDNKITLVVKNIPNGFGVFVVRAINNSVNDITVNVDYKSYQDFQQDSRLAKSKEDDEKTENANNIADLYITLQNDSLIEKELTNLSREDFALGIFNEEVKYQEEQRKRLTDAITALTNSIAEDSKVIEELDKESQYVIADDLLRKQDKVKSLMKSIDNKNEQIATAEENIALVDKILENLNNNIIAVKDGTYEFKAPVRSINKDIQ